MRWIVTLIIVALLVGGGWLAWRLAPKPSLDQRFRFAEVERGDLQTSVNASGTIQPIQTVQIGAFVSGPIKEIYVDFNTRVTKDQIIAKIDPRITRAQYDRDLAQVNHAKADVKRIEALLANANANLSRGKALEKINAQYIAVQEMDRLEAEARSLSAQLLLAQASVTQAESNMAQSKTNWEFTDIKSPVDGIVIDRKVDPGQTMAAAFQTPVMFTVAPELDKRVFVYASVDEADMGQIQLAKERKRPVSFTVDAHRDDLFSGEIAQVRLNHTTTQNVVTYTVVVEAPQSLTASGEPKLLPGMTANLSFQIEKREGTLKVPNAALRYYPQLAQVRPQDKKIIEGVLDEKTDRDAETDRESSTGQAVSAVKPSADERVAASRAAAKRIVWRVDPTTQLLAAVPIVIGMSDSRHTEVLEGDLQPGERLVSGNRSAFGR